MKWVSQMRSFDSFINSIFGGWLIAVVLCQLHLAQLAMLLVKQTNVWESFARSFENLRSANKRFLMIATSFLAWIHQLAASNALLARFWRPSLMKWHWIYFFPLLTGSHDRLYGYALQLDDRNNWILRLDHQRNFRWLYNHLDCTLRRVLDEHPDQQENW